MAKRNILINERLLKINLSKLVCGIGNQLRYVERFSTCRHHHRENVAEHQFYTAFFTLLICLHLKMSEADLGKAVIRALIHDVEEHATGDLIRPVKYSSPEIKNAMDKAGHAYAMAFFKALTEDNMAAGQLFQHWEDAKDETDLGRIVRFADFLSVVSYLDQEVRSGNRLVMDNVTQLRAYAHNFEAVEYEFILPLVRSAVSMVEELYEEAKNKRPELA